MQKCIVVLGMHRSGTSAFTGVLSILGINLGSNLMAPTEENPKGFFENYDIFQLNGRILGSLNSAWDEFFLLPEQWWQEKALEVYRKEAFEIIGRGWNNRELFGIKDPRLSVLLPFWENIFEELNIKPNYIIAVRHPLEVAGSLKRRDGFSIEKATLLWMNYMANAEYYSRSSPRIISSFDELLRNPKKIINNISSAFDISFPTVYGNVKSSIEQFLEPNLKHHTAKEMNNPDLLGCIMDYYNLLLYWDENENSVNLLKADELRKDFYRLYGYFYNSDFRNELKALRNELKALRNEIRVREKNMQEVLNSTSWKITGPLRKALNHIKNYLKTDQSRK